MKKNMFLMVSIMSLGSISLKAQQLVPTSTENYIQKAVYKKAYQESALGTVPVGDKIETINYFDGLGRPKESILVRQGGKDALNNDTDLITPIVYDAYGRQVKDYLPIASSLNDGKYKSINFTSDVDTYYYYKYYGEWTSIANANPYSEKKLDDSPFNRVMKQAAPGNDWKLGNGHEIEFAYLTNGGSEVRRYEVSTTMSTTNTVITFLPTLGLDTSAGNNNGYYEAGELFKTVTYDENHTSGLDHSTEEFKDKQGNIILKRTYDNGIKHDTYYVYDKYNNLTYVLPPKAEPDTTLPNATQLSELCYQYKYDDRNRLVEKKIPGKGWEYIVYNKLDQPILTQHPMQIVANNSSLTTNQWSFTKYDAFGRVAYTGLISTNSTRTALQDAADATTAQYETKNGSYSTIASTTIYYSNNAYPTSILELHTINYYDNYTFDMDTLSLPEYDYYSQQVINYNNLQQILTKGLATGSKVRVLGTNTWITTVTGYDKHHRPIWVGTKNNYLVTTDYVESKIDNIVGWVSDTRTRHIKSGVTLTTYDKFTYDHSGKLVKQTNKIGSNAEQAIAVNEYDELGQLKRKKVGGLATASGLQVVDYTYNIRGWLKGINDINNLGTVDLFAFKLNYNTKELGSTNAPLYNGNISETIWKTANDVGSNKTRGYAYKYDALNRITGADYGVKTTGSYSLASGFDVGIGSYDKNGNIISLWRDDATNGHKIDQLTYTYQAYSNKLNIVSDAILNTASLNEEFKDDYNSTSADTTIDYTYDTNGNMRTDANKGITSNITYNHLNLPTYVALPGGNISYFYDATGVKQKKIVSTGTTIDYAGNYVYENGVLKFFNTPEGYVDAENGYKYVYQYKDHLGNIRLSYKDISTTSTPSLQIQEENNYYPFGLQHKGYNSNVASTNIALKRKFGGNELQDDDINGSKLNWYDITARNYDPAIGRWMNLDPLAEKFVETSPYAYAKNNPVFFVDPNGEEPVPGPFTGKGWRSSNGTITVHRITAGQRYALNIYYATSVSYGGPVGTAFGLYDSAKIITNPSGTTQTRAGVATQLALDGASSFLLTDTAAKGYGEAIDASGKVLDNAGNIRTFAKTIKGGLNAIGPVAALTSDSSPTRNELISKWTFQFADSFIKGGNINIAQEGLFNVYDENATVEGTESRLNAIHAGINIFLAGANFDLDTEQGQADAAKYITDNAKYVAALTRYIYNYYNSKEEEND